MEGVASENVIDGIIPEQPIHHNCRCITVPVLEGTAELMQTGMSYEEWFSRRNEAEKIDILGPSRYYEYKKGNIKIDGFANNKNQIMTLDELKIDRVTRADLFENVYSNIVALGTALTEKEKTELFNWLSTNLEIIIKDAGLDYKSNAKWLSENIINNFDKMPPQLQRLLYNTRADISLASIDKDAFFKPNANYGIINLGKNFLSKNDQNVITFFHEWGHALSHRLSDTFSKTWQSELMYSLKNDWLKYKQYLEDNGNLNLIKINNKSNKKNPLYGYDMASASDIIRGLSDFEFSGNWGHKKGYYNKESIKEEAFAHLITSFIKDQGINSIFGNTLSNFNNWLETGHLRR